MSKLAASDYPEFYAASDRAAAKHQSAYFFWTRLHLVVLVLLAAVGGITASEETKAPLVVVSIVLMLIAVGLGVGLRHAKLDDKWFQCRAFAENAKRETWRYMMRVGHDGASDFRAAIDSIKSRFPAVSRALIPHLNNERTVTPEMERIRAASVAERFEIYSTHRIANQRAWYLAKAKENERSERIFFWLVLLTEIAAVGLLALASWLGWPFVPAGLAAALAGALLAWSQARRYSDLTTTYGVAHQDLQLIAEDANVGESEERLKSVVEAIEQSVSREHRMWLSKRGNQ